MNWVAPIKDEETLEKFKEKLREIDDKYYIMFEIGVGTGLQLQEILKFKRQYIHIPYSLGVCDNNSKPLCIGLLPLGIYSNRFSWPPQS